MAKGRSDEAMNEALFEDDYVLRTLGKIGYDSETALTELVANAWDAGASKVSIIIPEEVGGTLTVEDDGHGMTADNFRSRWMKLGYNQRETSRGCSGLPMSKITRIFPWYPSISVEM